MVSNADKKQIGPVPRVLTEWTVRTDLQLLSSLKNAIRNQNKPIRLDGFYAKFKKTTGLCEHEIAWHSSRVLNRYLEDRSIKLDDRVKMCQLAGLNIPKAFLNEMHRAGKPILHVNKKLAYFIPREKTSYSLNGVQSQPVIPVHTFNSTPAPTNTQAGNQVDTRNRETVSQHLPGIEQTGRLNGVKLSKVNPSPAKPDRSMSVSRSERSYDYQQINNDFVLPVYHEQSNNNFKTRNPKAKTARPQVQEPDSRVQLQPKTAQPSLLPAAGSLRALVDNASEQFHNYVPQPSAVVNVLRRKPSDLSSLSYRKKNIKFNSQNVSQAESSCPTSSSEQHVASTSQVSSVSKNLTVFMPAASITPSTVGHFVPRNNSPDFELTSASKMPKLSAFRPFQRTPITQVTHINSVSNESGSTISELVGTSGLHKENPTMGSLSIVLPVRSGKEINKLFMRGVLEAEELMEQRRSCIHKDDSSNQFGLIQDSPPPITNVRVYSPGAPDIPSWVERAPTSTVPNTSHGH